MTKKRGKQGPKSKVDRRVMSKMFHAGRSGRQIAKHFGVSQALISQYKRQLGIATTKNITLETASEVVRDGLDVISQLTKINMNANELLDLLMRWQRGEPEALQILESQVKMVKVTKLNNETGEIKEGDAEWVREIKFKDPRELALKAMAEIRGQLRLQVDIIQAIYDAKYMKEFQDEVIEAIGTVNKGVRDRIIQKLIERRAIRAVVKLDPVEIPERIESELKVPGVVPKPGD